jgi:hypothetical protein
VHFCNVKFRLSAKKKTHRVWKGCLSTSQQAQIRALTDLPMSWKEKTVLISSLRHVQYLFATAILRIRTQLTSYALPHMRGALFLPTPHQLTVISTLRNQPRITEALWGFGARMSQDALASRNSLKRRKAKAISSTQTQRGLCFHLRDMTAITLQGPIPPTVSSPASGASPSNSLIKSRQRNPTSQI